MSTVKTKTFKRTVNFTQPSEEVDQFTADSFVAEFKTVPNSVYEGMRKAPGGIRDLDLMTAALIGASNRSVDEVLEDPIACSAATRVYLKAQSEGIAAKNSAT